MYKIDRRGGGGGSKNRILGQTPVRTKYGLNNKTKKVEKIRQVYLQNIADKTSREARSLGGGQNFLLPVLPGEGINNLLLGSFLSTNFQSFIFSDSHIA